MAIYSAPTLAWWHCDWNYRFPVSISQPPGSPVTDYQVRLNLNASNVPGQFDWSLLGDDLRVVDQDNQTEIGFYIEQWIAPG